ncbi:glycosyltransferase [Flavobacterium sp. UBA7663]|uniref:glycosyltransferase n=1 Tax=Flavobacterium sp. UBA7663 TaxID=1946557 RepID=UPI0025C3F232|nr:glycosyltransferase [Flavobacterium sp. UBA7663]
MKKKRIVILMSALNGGGAEKVLIDYLRNLNYSKYEVTLCLVINEGVYLKDVPKEVSLGFLYAKFALFPYRLEHWLSKFLGWNYFQKKRVEKHFKNQKFDVVISFMEGIPLKFHSYFLSKAPKHLSWVHTDLFHDHYSLSCFKDAASEQALYQKMNTIIFVSEESKKQFERLYAISNKKEVIYNIIDKKNILSHLNEITPERQEDKINIIAVGRLEVQKRFDRLIDVAKLLKEHSCSFQIQIIGEGSLLGQLEHQITENDVADCISLKGFVKSPYALMNESDIVVISSETEGFSLVVAEALCLGKAIVSTATVGPMELLANGEYGIICDHTVTALFEALQSLINDSSKLEKYQKLALERSLIFDTQKSIVALENCIDNE